MSDAADAEFPGDRLGAEMRALVEQYETEAAEIQQGRPPLTDEGRCWYHPDLLPMETTLAARHGCIGCQLSRNNLDPHYAAEEPVPVIDCDWEHGVALCPCCSAVVRIVPRQRFTPRVVDADGRAHYCERYIAAAMQRHGVDGMQPIIDKHADRPVIDPPHAPTVLPPGYGGTGL